MILWKTSSVWAEGPINSLSKSMGPVRRANRFETARTFFKVDLLEKWKTHVQVSSGKNGAIAATTHGSLMKIDLWWLEPVLVEITEKVEESVVLTLGLAAYALRELESRGRREYKEN